jgi:hypothetical protein
LQEIATLPLSPWESFYVIVGSSAAALTGLQFVVIALVAEAQRVRPDTGSDTIDAFGTPTVVHFCAVLLMSATLSAPWHTLTPAAWVLGASGVAGVCYAALVTVRARRQTGYKPVFEDWIFHSILPFAAYGALLVAAAVMIRDSTASLFCIGAVSLLLLFVGIHNAWDTVTYIATTRMAVPADDAERP